MPANGLHCEPFEVDVQRSGDAATVRPRGELDLATISELRGALDGLESFAHLVLDLRRLSFVDSSGLHLLVELSQKAQRDGFELTLIAPQPPVDRAIRLCGLYEALPFVPAAASVDHERAA
jgi:anti-sigma B factor antagonist